MAQVGFDVSLYIGKTINNWTIIEKTNVKGRTRVNVICSCNNKVNRILAEIVSGKTKKCLTCHNREVSKNRITHGLSKTGTYKSWASMVHRCNTPETNGYNYYGGRGIKVCNEWLKFENFYKDMGLRPKGTVLDRIDNDGNYESSNCRWISPSENNYNRGGRYKRKIK